jgi:hypothetical protein
VYVHANVVDAVTASQVAAVSLLPVSRTSDDDPVDVIASEKVTRIATELPTEYAPESVEDVTPVTVGAVVSMTNELPLVTEVPAFPARSVPVTDTVAVPSK